MKKTLIAFAVVTLIATALSFGVAHWFASRSGSQQAVNLNDAAWLKHALNLTDAQAAEVEKLESGFRAKLESCCDAHCSARFALSSELARPQVDLAKAKACMEQMNAAQADSERATLDHILQVRAILTPAQQKRYADLVSQQICMAGPMGLHHPS